MQVDEAALERKKEKFALLQPFLFDESEVAAGRRRSDRQGRSGTALATDQPQEGRPATDGPDIYLGRAAKAAFVFETWMSLPKLEVARGGTGSRSYLTCRFTRLFLAVHS